MQYVRPQVFMLAETMTRQSEIYDMLQAIGVSEDACEQHAYQLHVTDGEHLIEILGRLCYKSFEVGLNANVTKIREGNREYLGNIQKQKHGSVFEHSTVTFGLIGVSRILTHEEVRHRAGTAFSQESLRFVRLDNIRFYMPDAISNHPDKRVRTEAIALIEDAVRTSELGYAKLCQLFGIDDPNNTFAEKKKLTSAFRRIALEGLCTDLAVTANHRAWRHMIEVRTAAGAEEEIRLAFHLIAERLQQHFPNIYQDMSIHEIPGSEIPEYRFANSKI